MFKNAINISKPTILKRENTWKVNSINKIIWDNITLKIKNTFVVYTCRFLHERKDSAPNRKGLTLDKDILDCQTDVITIVKRTRSRRIKVKGRIKV